MNVLLPKSGCTACFTAILVVLFMACNANAIGLSEILVRVEQHTPALQAARAETGVQQAALRQAKSRYFGEIDGVIKNSNYDSGRLINPMTYPPDLRPDCFDDNQIGYGIVAHVPLDINGRINAMVDAAKKQVRAARASQSNVRLGLLHSASALYYSLEGVKATEDALEKQIQALAAHIKVASASIKAGRTALVEKLRLVADREAVKGKLAALYGREQEIRAQLAALMGTDSFSDAVVPLTKPPVKVFYTADDIMNRPDIRALEFKGKAADAGIKAAVSARFPELNLDGSWIRNQGFNGEGDDTWAMFVELKLPVWDGGSRKAAVAKAEAGSRAVRNRLTSLQNQAKAELAAAKADAIAAEASYNASLASVKAALATEKIQGDRFSKGRISAADLVDAEAALAEARSGRAMALAYWWQAEDRIRRAVGIEPFAYHRQNQKISARSPLKNSGFDSANNGL